MSEFSYALKMEFKQTEKDIEYYLRYEYIDIIYSSRVDFDKKMISILKIVMN